MNQFYAWPSLIPHQALMEKSWFVASGSELTLASARLLKFKLFLRKGKWLHLSEFACGLVVGAALNIVKNVALKGFTHATLSSCSWKKQNTSSSEDTFGAKSQRLPEVNNSNHRSNYETWLQKVLCLSRKKSNIKSSLHSCWSKLQDRK